MKNKIMKEEFTKAILTDLPNIAQHCNISSKFSANISMHISIDNMKCCYS